MKRVSTPAERSDRSNVKIVVPINHLDYEDFAPMIEHSTYKDRMLILIDTNTIAAGPVLSADRIEVDFQTPREVIRAVRSWARRHGGRITAVITLDEEYGYAVSAAIAAAFGLPFFKPEVIRSVVDKHRQIQALDACGIDVPDFVVVAAGGKSNGIPYPNVLKPLFGVGSRCVFLNRDRQDFEKNLATGAAFFDANREFGQGHATGVDFLLESYIDGKEYSCDFMILKSGQARVFRVVRKLCDPEAFPFFGGFLLFNPDCCSGAPFSTTQLEALCTRVAQALSITSGVCMLDFRFANGRFFVLETTVRPGISQFIDLMIDLYGYTSLDLLIAHTLGVETCPSLPTLSGLLLYFSTEREGRVVTFDTRALEQDMQRLDVIRICKYYRQGDVIPCDPARNFRKSIGHVLIKNVQLADIEAVSAAVNRRVRIEVVPCNA